MARKRKQDLKNILDIYNSAGIDPNSVTIDLFAIYSIYQQIEYYKKKLYIWIYL